MQKHRIYLLLLVLCLITTQHANNATHICLRAYLISKISSLMRTRLQKMAKKPKNPKSVMEKLENVYKTLQEMLSNESKDQTNDQKINPN